MELQRGTKVNHPEYGECFYVGLNQSGEAIIEHERDGEIKDRILVNINELKNIHL